jgi:hypothetical protein
MMDLTAKDHSRSTVRFTGVLLSLWMTGCAGVAHPPSGNGTPETGPALADAPAVTPATETSAAPQVAAPPVAATPQPAPDALVAGPPKAPPKKPSSAPSTAPAANPATKATGGSATAAAAAIPAPPPPSAPSAPPSSGVSPQKQPTSPPLDLKALVARLRETKAIGMFTKLALKNQVDDLLDRFREHYASQLKTPVAELRPPYDRLLLKVLAAVQDEDPDLARAIVDSREPIWNILADPARFATI